MGTKLKNHEETRATYNKEMLIKDVAEITEKNINTVRVIYNALEDNIVKLLSFANPNTDVIIRLFEGISICGTFVPEKTKVNNLTGKPITVKSKIKVKANITDNYCDKITNYNK